MFLKKKKDFDATSGPIISGMLAFAIPLILTSFFNYLFHTIDTAMLGRWGGESVEAREYMLAAVGSCGIPINIISNLFTAFSTGSLILASREYGTKNADRIQNVFRTVFSLSILCSAVCSSIGILFCRPILVASGVSEVLLDTATSYMRVYFFGMPATMIYFFCAALLRAKGDTTPPLIIAFIGGGVNCALNAVMIFFFRMGATGVALATAITQYVMIALLLLYMVRLEAPFRIPWSRLGFDKETLSGIFRAGFPLVLQSLVSASLRLSLQSAVNAYDPFFIAGYTVAVTITSYISLVQGGFLPAALVFVGQNTGAGNFPRLKQVLLKGMLLLGGVGLGLGLLVYFISPFALDLLCPGNAPAVESGMVYISFFCLPYFLCALTEFGRECLRGMGKNALPTTFSVSSAFLSVGWIFVYNTYFKGDPRMLFFAQPVLWFLELIAVCISILIVYRRTVRKHQGASVEQANSVPSEIRKTPV